MAYISITISPITTVLRVVRLRQLRRVVTLRARHHLRRILKSEATIMPQAMCPMVKLLCEAAKEKFLLQEHSLERKELQ
jgi:hypothetical protein